VEKLVQMPKLVKMEPASVQKTPSSVQMLVWMCKVIKPTAAPAEMLVEHPNNAKKESVSAQAKSKSVAESASISKVMSNTAEAVIKPVPKVASV